jgi:hypothetical protein
MAAIRRKQFVLQPAGAAGSAVATQQYSTGRPGILRFIKIDYGSGVPATSDIVIKRDDSSGATVLTRTSSTTDVGPIAVGTAGMDEAQAASAATDGLSGGIPFTSGLYIDVAQADPYADSTDEITIDFYWEPIRKKTLTLVTDAAGADTDQWTLGRAGVVRFIQVDYDAAADAAMTMVVKRDDSSGTTVFTKSTAETDFGPTAVGTTAGDEAFAATAATDAVSGGIPFNTGLHTTIASGGNTKTTVVYLWYDA